MCSHISACGHATFLYQFPIAAVINYYSFSGFKQQTFIIQRRRSEVQNESHQAKIKSLFSLQKLQRKSVSLPSAASRGSQHSMACGLLSTIFKSSSVAFSRFSLTLTSSLTSLFYFKESSRLHWAHLDKPGYSKVS